MRTAIFTTRKTVLTVHTSELVQLVQMSSPAQLVAPSPIEIAPGTRQVTVEAGVFKIVSATRPIVTGDGPITVLSTENDKDTGWPDTALAPKTADATAVRGFFVIAGARSL